MTARTGESTVDAARLVVRLLEDLADQIGAAAALVEAMSVPVALSAGGGGMAAGMREGAGLAADAVRAWRETVRAAYQVRMGATDDGSDAVHERR